VNSAADFSVFAKFGSLLGHVTTNALKVEGHEVKGQNHDKTEIHYELQK